MCSVCLQSPCHSRCPNAPEPVPTYTCCECGEGIYKGEKYFDGADGTVCKNCMEEMTVSKLLELVGESLMTA